jgi:hypothetical protein
MDQQAQLRELERSSYYAVVRALFACRKLETFVGTTHHASIFFEWPHGFSFILHQENELLLTDLQEALNISEQDRLVCTSFPTMHAWSFFK